MNCNIKLFADDTCLYVIVEDKDQATQSLNENLENVKQWADQWVVDFNAAKTKSMTISNKNVLYPPIIFDGKELEDVTCHKHLGLTLNRNLNWSDHIDGLIHDVSKILDVMRKLKYDVDRESLEKIYFSFIRPKLEYACQIWDSCQIRDNDRLENLQLCAARIVTGAKKGTSHQRLYEDVSWPKLSDRRAHIKLLHMHKIVNANVPPYLSQVLPQRVAENTHYELRDRNHIKQFQCRTEKFRKSFFPDCIRIWNNLDESTRSMDDLTSFKNSLTDISLKSPCLYNYGKRKYNIIHAQLRLKCSNLKAHLTALHVIDNPQCHCSFGIEDNHHFFFQCPLYYIQREQLKNAVQQYTTFELNVLLFGDKQLKLEQNKYIFAAVHTYIKDSQRFVD